MAVASLERLPHLSAFEAFVGEDTGKIDALVAFGLYMQAECLWAESLSSTPSNSDIKKYHESGVSPYFLDRTRTAADDILQKYVDEAIQSHQASHLRAAIHSATEAVHNAPKSFWRGVGEAIAGAALWTLILIVISVIANRFGIDLLEVYKRVSGTP